jgi:hypothetical protein
MRAVSLITPTVEKELRTVPRSPMRVVAVDPGEAWTGVARLDVEPVLDTRMGGVVGVQFVLDARLIHSKPRTLLETVSEVMFALPAPRPFESVLVLEAFAMRGQGFNTFSAGNTLRLIGALEYAVQYSQRMALATAQPADPDKNDLLHNLSNRALVAWMRDWPSPSASNWHHVRSAWRVLCDYLFRTRPNVLSWLRDARVYEQYNPKRATFPIMDQRTEDRLAPEARMVWRHKSLKSVNLDEGVADSDDGD